MAKTGEAYVFHTIDEAIQALGPQGDPLLGGRF
jgi:hypothetical protein